MKPIGQVSEPIGVGNSIRMGTFSVAPSHGIVRIEERRILKNGFTPLKI